MIKEKVLISFIDNSETKTKQAFDIIMSIARTDCDYYKGLNTHDIDFVIDKANSKGLKTLESKLKKLVEVIHFEISEYCTNEG